MSTRRPTGRLNEILGPGWDRPVILGEYPYYRADPVNWRGDLARLAELGVDVVTFYVPWRFHEVADGAAPGWDFAGTSDRQRDVLGLLRSIEDAGLRAIVKPGPFVHGEIQIGGLPDRVCRTESFSVVVDAAGAPARSQRRPLPTFFAPAFRRAVAEWYGAVSEQVLTHNLHPEGPIVGVQLGNEGLYSDASDPVSAHDFSAEARAAFAESLRRQGDAEHAALSIAAAPPWGDATREAWAGWSGQALGWILGELSDRLPGDVPHLVNLPLPLLGDNGEAESWVCRLEGFRRSGAALGYTSWVGNATRSRAALGSHLMGVRLSGGDNVEENWGHTWSDSGYAEPHVPVFHALLALALGSRSLSVYTACATSHWDERIDLDAEALRADGVDPALYDPPYCPGAPLREGGGRNPNATALEMVRDLVRWHGEALAAVRWAPDALLVIDPAEARAAAWRAEPGSWLSRTARSLADLLIDHGCETDVTAQAPAGPPSAAAPQVVSSLDEIDVSAAAEARGGPSPRSLPTDGDRALDGHGGFSLRHQSEAGDRQALFAFNAGSRPARIGRRLGRLDVDVLVDPGGSCAVLTESDVVTGYLYRSGSRRAVAPSAEALSAGELRLEARELRETVARVSGGTWQVRRYPGAGDRSSPHGVAVAQ